MTKKQTHPTRAELLSKYIKLRGLVTAINTFTNANDEYALQLEFRIHDEVLTADDYVYFNYEKVFNTVRDLYSYLDQYHDLMIGCYMDCYFRINATSKILELTEIGAGNDNVNELNK